MAFRNSEKLRDKGFVIFYFYYNLNLRSYGQFCPCFIIEVKNCNNKLFIKKVFHFSTAKFVQMYGDFLFVAPCYLAACQMSQHVPVFLYSYNFTGIVCSSPTWLPARCHSMYLSSYNHITSQV